MGRFGNLQTRAEQVVARCRQLARFSEDPTGTRRTFLSAPMRDCHREISGWLKASGADVTVDAAGNLRALYAGEHRSAPSLLIGSHLDTVPNAGAFDGVLGVLVGIALLEALDGRHLPFGIEIVGFSEEEGVRFGVPFIGSRALVGRLDDNLLNQKDARGISLRTAIKQFGLDPAELNRAKLDESTLAYLEFHIEQGPVLESLNRPLGVVEAIVGQTRMEFTFLGRSNHAGTTPMQLRRDALAGAAEWVVAVERVAQTTPGLIATVGRFEGKPGVTNVIAGEAKVTLDLRHKSDEIRAHAKEEIVKLANEIATRRALMLRNDTHLDQHAVFMDPFLLAQVDLAVQAAGCEPYRMVSGAGHDTMILAEKVPAAMIFLRSPGGISHDPAESVEAADVAKALECGLFLLDQLTHSAEFQKRVCRA